MTDINAAAETARENARQSSGQFGEQQHSAPDATLSDQRVPLPIITTVMLSRSAPIPYPVSLPPGGTVTADFEDSGGVFVSIEFKDQFDKDGDPIRISLGGEGYDSWDSISNDELGFTDSNLNDDTLSYLRELHTAIDADAEAVRITATEPHLASFVQRATQPVPESDYSDEASWARSRTRGEQLIGAFADGGNELEDNAADAIADILAYAKAQGLDIDDLARRAVDYCEDA